MDAQIEPDAQPTFHALPEPKQGEIAAVAWSTCERTVKLLKKRGLWSDADSAEDSLAQKEPLLSALASASIAGVLAMGPHSTRWTNLTYRPATTINGQER